MDHRSLCRPSRATIAAALALLSLSTVALSDAFVTDARQRGTVLDAGGRRLVGQGPLGTAGPPISTVTVGEALVHPLQLTGGALVMRPGFIAKKKLMQAQAPTTGVETAQASPTYVNRLQGNHPNPFNPTTTIGFTLAQPGAASLKIYDVRGRLVRTLVDAPMEVGDHQVRWDGRSTDGSRVASGVYFMRLVAGDFVEQRKLTLAR